MDKFTEKLDELKAEGVITRAVVCFLSSLLRVVLR
jgi:hypothetical protein